MAPNKNKKGAKKAAAGAQSSGNATPTTSAPSTPTTSKMATPASPIVPSPVTPATDTLPTSPGADPMDVDAQPVKKEEETLTADQVKEKGNVAFKAGRYGDAIDLYSKAIGVSLS